MIRPRTWNGLINKAASKLRQDIVDSQNADVDMEESKGEQAPSPPADLLTYEEKLELTNQIKKLSQEKLTKLVKVIIQKNDISIKDKKEGDLIQIELDLIDRQTYQECKQIIAE